VYKPGEASQVVLDVLALSNSSMVERREADVWTGDACSKRADPFISRVSEDLRAKRVELYACGAI